MPKTLISFFLAFTLNAFADGTDFNYDSLKKLVIEKDIKRIDDLIPLFPTEYLENPILVYDSHARNAARVTPENPRVLLFNRTGNLTMTFTKKLTEEEILDGDDGLEVINFNSVTNKFEMRELVFNGQRNPFADGAEPAVNPKMCTKCHGLNPRPIFQDYNGWPGMYGSYSQTGFSSKKGLEYGFFKTFLKKQTAADRYKYLKLNSITEDRDGSYYKGTYSSYLNPTIIFGQQLEFKMLQRAAAKMANHSEFQNLRPLLSYLGSKTCGNQRETIRHIYSVFTSGEERSKKAEILTKKILAQITQDFDLKKKDFFEFNFEGPTDPRGLLTLPHIAIEEPELDPYNGSTDPIFIRIQFVLIESLFQQLGFETADISTNPKAPTLGIFHVRHGRLDPDEKYFNGIADALDKLNPDWRLPSNTPEACADLKNKSGDYLKNVPVPSGNSGIIYLDQKY